MPEKKPGRVSMMMMMMMMMTVIYLQALGKQRLPQT
jgi:hypothetical protein